MIRLMGKIKGRMGPLWWYAAVMFCVQRVADLINIYTGLWLVPKWIHPDELGAVLPLGQIGALLGLPLAILLTPFMKYLNTFGAREENGKVKALLSDALLLASVSAVAIAAYTWISAPYVFERLRIGGTGLVWLLCGIAVTSAFMPVLSNGLQALKLFRCIGLVGITAAPIRLVLLVALLPLYGLTGFFSAQFLSNVTAIGVSLLGLRHILSSAISRQSYRMHLREMIGYTAPIAVVLTVGTVQYAVQLLVIRQRLPDVESAAFYFGSRFSEIPSIIWAAISVAFFPMISEAYEKGRETRRDLIQVLLFTVIGGAIVALGLGLASDRIFSLVESWRAYQPYAYLVMWMAMINVFRVAYGCFMTHELACRRFGFIWYAAPLALGEAGLMISLTGYGFFIPYFPPSWIEWMGSIHAARLDFIVGVMFVSSCLTFIGLMVHIFITKPKLPEMRTV
jgi:O-antigen/teichoic acid export membrane protein